MKLQVLGSIEAVDGSGERVDLGGPTQRRLAAILAVKAGQVVASERLGETLGLSPGGVRTAVRRLRQVLGSEAVATVPPGYVLCPANTDVAEFTAMLDDAHEAAPGEAAKLLTRALGLWTGAALEEFADETWAQAAAAGLEEQRVAAEEARAEARLSCGCFAEVASEMAMLIQDHPYRDGPRGLLMRALAGQGRQTEALRSYQAYRTLLAEEAGTEPSKQLRDLESRIATGWSDPPAASSTTTELPTGTVTCLLSRIDGHTLAWDAHPLEAQACLTIHESVVRDEVARRGGQFLSAAGDRVAAVFSRVEDAVLTAVAAQCSLTTTEWPAALPVAVGMGLHTGDASDQQGTYHVAAFAMASSLADLAHGGQILGSSATADLAPPSVEVIPMGRQRMSHQSESVRIAQLAAEGLPRHFPPPRARSASNLPWDPSSFVGRRRELADLRTALGSSSLVTIIGVGGIGKTRLALEAGHLQDARDGTTLVELGRLDAPDQVDEFVASALGVSAHVGSASRAAVLAWLAERETLLILDNCEHLLGAVAELVDAIASGASDTTVLATSREPLSTRGERLIALGALSLPGEGVEQSEAVTLFVDRAGPAAPGDEAALAAVDEICRRLDGIPLAIELAAARMTTMSAQDIADHLGERFRLLTGGRRTAVARHQTLQAAIEWSHRLLDPREQQHLAHLSVFSGPFNLRDAVAIEGEGADEIDVLDRLASLVNRSLVVHSNDLIPYRMLETIRAFGRMNLDADGQSEALRWRHARHFHARAKELHAAVYTAEGPAANRLVRSQGVDYLAAVRWAHDCGDLALASDLLNSIVELTSDAYGWREPGLLAEQLVAGYPAPPPGAAVIYLHASWSASLSQGRADLGGAFASTAIELDPDDWSAHTLLGIARVLSGDPAGALLAAEHARSRATVDHLHDWCLTLVTCCWYYVMLGRDAEAREAADELLEQGRLTGLPGLLVWAHLAQARARSGTDPDAALEWYRSAEAYVETLEAESRWQQLRRDRASVLLDRDLLAASRDLDWCLSTARASGTPGFAIAAVSHAVVALARLGEFQAAALLHGSSYSSAAAPFTFEAVRLAATDHELRIELGDQFDELTRRGKELSIVELTDVALAALERHIGDEGDECDPSS